MSGKTKKGMNVIVWILFGLLIFSLGGFGISSFGSTVRSIGSVGTTEITTNEYRLALDNILHRMRGQDGSTLSLNSEFGQQVSGSVRQQLLASAALKHETERLGISIGDEAIRDELLQVSTFKGLDGQFDREIYSDTLRRIGYQESEYEEGLRSDAAANITAGAVLSGFEAHETMAQILAEYAGERRDLMWLKLDASDLPEPVAAPTDEQIQAEYDENPDAYMAPETKNITYISLTPEMMLGTIEVPEEDLRAVYEERDPEYNKPERRLVERLVFPDQDAANAAKEALDNDATFESLVEGRGLSLLDVDLGDVSLEELGDAGAEIFALDGLGVVGPLDSPLGPALFRVNGVIAATTTPFEDVRDDLQNEAERDRAVRLIDDMREDIDDLLAGGATLEEIADETEMELDTLSFTSATAEGVVGYAVFREAAAASGEGDFPELIFLEDGGLASLRVDEVIAPALRPLDDVRDQVIADWTRKETDVSLGYFGETLRVARMEGKTLQDQGYSPESHTDLARSSYLDGAPEGLVDTLFALKDGETEIFTENGILHVIELARITPLTSDSADEDATALQDSLKNNIVNASSADTRELFLRAIQTDAGINLNQAAINAVNATFP